MLLNDAINAFGALSQETRLRALRFLVQKAPNSIPAGEIAVAMKVPQNTMSSHLSILVRAGLLKSTKSGRAVLYAIDLEGLRGLITFLVTDCCQGQPEDCSLILSSIIPNCDVAEV